MAKRRKSKSKSRSKSRVGKQRKYRKSGTKCKAMKARIGSARGRRMRGKALARFNKFCVR